MEIGICAGIEQASCAAEAGYDYIELPLCTLAAMTNEEYKQAKCIFEKSGIPCKAFNLLLSGNLEILGEKADREKLKEYAELAFVRASEFGGKTVVFGSGGARKIPEGISREKAWEQMVEVSRILGEIAQKYEIEIVLEPLNHGETDLLNTVSEGIAMVQDISNSSVWLLADYYHMQREGEVVDVILRAATYLKHCHIACEKCRRFPKREDEVLCRRFLKSLSAAGYKGRISVEGLTDQFAEDARESLLLLRKILGD